MPARIFFVLAFTFLELFSAVLSAYGQQEILKGQVADEQSRQPLAGASVFIDNSTYGNASDEQGQFSLGKFPVPPFELTITAIGYESRTIRVNQADLKQPIFVTLKTKTISLDEVAVRIPERNGWEQYGKMFTEEFIGYSGFAAQCEIINKEVLEFWFDKDRRSLMVTATQPIKIRNNATGYLITYWLEDFELNYASKRTYFKGYTQYEPLSSKRKNRLKQWERNRISAYQGSLSHFMRSVYKGNVLQEGFEIRTLKRVDKKELGRYVPKRTDTIAYEEQEQVKKMIVSVLGSDTNPLYIMNTLAGLDKWVNDTLNKKPYKITGKSTADSTMTREYLFTRLIGRKDRLLLLYFEFQKEKEDEISAPEDNAALLHPHLNDIKFAGVPDHFSFSKLPFDILYTDLVPLDSLVLRRDNQSLQFYAPDYLHITYLREKEEEPYLKRQSLIRKAMPEDQVSIFSIQNQQGITIYNQGNFKDSYDVLVEQYWSYEKMDKLLPLDYKP